MVCGPFPSPLPLWVRAARKNGPSPPDDVAGPEVGGSPFAAISVFSIFSISECLPRVCPEEASSVGARSVGPLYGQHEASSLLQKQRGQGC